MGAMPGMTMSAGGADSAVLPGWLSLVWVAAFAVVLVVHARHARTESGERRAWHAGHVVMAAGMGVMFLPLAVGTAALWQPVFVVSAAVTAAWIAVCFAWRRPVNALWPLMAVDLAAMIAMWSPGGWGGARAWPVVAYLAGQSVLWITDRVRVLDRHPLLVGVDVPGAATVVSVRPLISRADLRVSMATMTLGMAFMVAAMQLAA